MKFLPLMIANLFRKKIRTALTIGSSNTVIGYQVGSTTLSTGSSDGWG